MLDDDNPLIKPLKTAFFERAHVFAAHLQAEVDAGQMTSEEANRRLVAIMGQPEMLQAVIDASVAHETVN